MLDPPRRNCHGWSVVLLLLIVEVSATPQANPTADTVFVFIQKYLVAGWGAGGVKG